MSDDDEDDYAYYGTPLEILDEDNIRARKAQRIEDQIATDDRGRRRFHGAFTGGFSAGYFNSVGSKEGWAPSTFVSSRAQRAESIKQRTESFMDEEDMAVHGIAPQAIRPTANFDSSEERKRKRVLDPDGPIPGVPVLEELLKPSKETMGMKLLRNLGWKPGQGIGPRLNFKQKTAARLKISEKYSCVGPQEPDQYGDESGNVSDDLDDAIKKATFAPDDATSSYVSHLKSDVFGLGYKPLDRTSILGGHFSLFDPAPLSLMEKKKKVLIKGQAFGIGAFEEEDEDIYASEDMSSYDFGPEREEGKSTSKRLDGIALHQSLLGLEKSLKGFKLSSQPLLKPKYHPPPLLPKGYIPIFKSKKRRFEAKVNETLGLGRHQMNSEHRAHIISEQKKVMVEIRCGIKNEPVKAEKNTRQTDTDIDQIFEEFKNCGEKCQSEFKPFSREPAKQKRYELFLKMKAGGHRDRFYLAQPRTLTEWEKEREMREFDRAAQLFQPLASTMASRFVTAATIDTGLTLKDGLNTDVSKLATMILEDSNKSVDALGGCIKDDRIKAAKIHMFGHLTQQVQDWHPDRLLCRRFNVPHPYPESSHVGVIQTSRSKFSLFNDLNAPLGDTAGLQDIKAEEDENNSEREEETVGDDEEEIEDDSEESVNNYGLKVLVTGPPTMDLFKAIFDNSDSDSDADESRNTHGSVDKKGESTKIESELLVKDQSQAMKHTLNISSANNGSNDDYRSGFIKPGTSKEICSDEATSSTDEIYKNGRSRKSRFEPLLKNKIMISEEIKEKNVEFKERTKEIMIGINKSNINPVFIPRKKNIVCEVDQPQGIFSDIDFNELNKFRTMNKTDTPGVIESDKDPLEAQLNINELTRKDKNKASDSSTDSDDAYGPPVPEHLKNNQQMIRTNPIVLRTPINTTATESDWIIKASVNKLKNKEKHREKKHKKEKKKKKYKHSEKKKRKKSKKVKVRSSKSSDSTSETDSSDCK